MSYVADVPHEHVLLSVFFIVLGMVSIHSYEECRFANVSPSVSEKKNEKVSENF